MQKGIKNVVYVAYLIFAFFIFNSLNLSSLKTKTNLKNHLLQNHSSSQFQKTQFFNPKKAPNSGTEQNEEDKIENEDKNFEVSHKIDQHNKNFSISSLQNKGNTDCVSIHFRKIGLYIFYHSLKIPFKYTITV
jgi:hypothetical protein